MRRNGFVFEGLDEIEDRIGRLSGEVAYLAISDRTDRNHEEQLGRFDFTMKDALPYLAQGADNREPQEEEQLFETIEAEVSEEEEEESDDGEKPSEDLVAIAAASCRWLRDIARRNTVGEPYRRFRVKIYGQKGLRVVDTASFVCKNTDHDLELPVHAAVSPTLPEPELRIPTPTFEDAANSGASRGYRALGDAYAQFSQIVLGSVGQLQGINNATQARMHKQLQESRDQVEHLVAAILEFRVAEVKASDERRADERNSGTRTELAKHALAQLGEMAKALLVARGIPAELADTLGPISQNPNLVSALSDPDVRALLEEPQNLDMIAGMLRQAGQQARLMREATSPQTHTS